MIILKRLKSLFITEIPFLDLHMIDFCWKTVQQPIPILWVEKLDAV